MNPEDKSRRELLKGALGTGALAAGAAVVPNMIFPALAQGETLVPFTDVPDTFNVRPVRPNSTHYLDTREITSYFTDNDDFYLVQHYGQPEVDNDSWRLRITGMVDNELEFSLQDLMDRDVFEQQAGFECGGNGRRLFQGLIGNAYWKGVGLQKLLEEAGIQNGAKEIVFFGTDIATEEIRDTEVDKAFARALSIEDAMRPENMLAFEMNGEPLPHYHGKPVRLLIPGWYGVANVKWINQIHVQDTRYMGRFMGRDYVTLKKVDVGGVERWVENSVTTMNLKSSIVRVVESGGRHKIQGFALNDGTPIESIEVKIDNGPWQRAQINPRSTKYSWKLFSFDWDNASAGDHTIVSRVTDINGEVQATQEEMPEQVSFWEDFGQFTRTITI
ncbi:MAG: molybdopterin-dependent oxidoreductase [Gammaproteobacteria bacterium]|jgi:DMSO/TMAO reductase YedYZ molybdopterin-dependent catalytic subunit|nr:molybdopterin-dependent oxidoreductase [Gammaproteobacteria bacterium]MBT3860411.1 molybdopterin-dependent oxidoreductase [Gammaproteobacteria bacterium]MBT3988708.1 molybdopterin-dependent oxidoreductase [Gammaproteobacteria bacterium]MBT4255125.1 molybdopterin-dependent oxidoreductase [Gammaproteobacteria bacterium]MBT4581430.1 molybdopterin-dependent oxidoreductase [Gammaproteobacteria bacterium]